MIFPIEIWEKIFVHIDPVDLTGLRITCKCWCTIIDRVLKENNHWHKKFIAEVPSNEWASLYEKVYPYENPDGCHYTEVRSEVWMRMYKLWTICRKLTKTNTTIKLVNPVPQTVHITCVTACDNILGIGSSEGYIYFYKCNSLNKPPIYVADHMEYVSDVKFLRNEKRLMAVSLSINLHVKFWDVRLKKLLTTTRGKLICTSYNNCYSIMNNVLSVRGSTPKTQYEFHIRNFIAMAVANSKVSLYSAGGDFIVWNRGSQREDFTSVSVPLPNLRIRQCYIFKVDIAVCITDDGFLGFSIAGGEWKIHNIFSIFHGVPTAVLIYASTVIIGLDSGDVLIVHVVDFNSLDFGTADSKTITLDTAPIESLDITHRNGSVCLIAACVQAVHVINFH